MATLRVERIADQVRTAFVQLSRDKLTHVTSVSPLVWKDVPLVQMVVCPDERNNFEYLTMLTLVVL